MPQVSVSIPQTLIDRMKEKVNTGLYSSNSEVVREGLRLLFKEHLGDDEITKFNHYLDSLAQTDKKDFLDTCFNDIIKRKHEQHKIKSK